MLKQRRKKTRIIKSSISAGTIIQFQRKSNLFESDWLKGRQEIDLARHSIGIGKRKHAHQCEH